MNNEMELKDAMIERFRDINVIDYDESSKKCYLRFIVRSNSQMHMAEKDKESKMIKYYGMIGSVICHVKEK